jgi:hypothetical protein
MVYGRKVYFEVPTNPQISEPFGRKVVTSANALDVTPALAACQSGAFLIFRPAGARRSPYRSITALLKACPYFIQHFLETSKP